MIRHAIQLLGPALTILGVLLSSWGTYRLTRWYHPFTAGGFWTTIGRVVILSFRGEILKLLKEAEIATIFASSNPEAKAESLLGVYYIFLGFILQLIGACFWGVDALWGILAPRS